MSWYSDNERFDEYEGCSACNFNKRPSEQTCKGCTSGDYWNEQFIDEEEEDEDDK